MTALLYLAAILSAIAIHELGHAAVARMYGVHTVGGRHVWRSVGTAWFRIRGRRVLPVGLAVKLRADRGDGSSGYPVIPQRAQSAISLGGPVASLAVAVLALMTGHLFIALVNADFAIINLIPFPHSDGRTILRAVRS